MAGAVRQPIDVPSLERYINGNVPEIQTPLEVKQVRMRWCILTREYNKLIRWLVTVRFRTIKPDLPGHCRGWKTLRLAKEAPGQASVEDGTQGRAGIQDHPSARANGRSCSKGM